MLLLELLVVILTTKLVQVSKQHNNLLTSFRFYMVFMQSFKQQMQRLPIILTEIQGQSSQELLVVIQERRKISSYLVRELINNYSTRKEHIW